MTSSQEMRTRVLGVKGVSTRQRILDYLRDLLDVEPLHHLTIKNIAWEANVSPSAFWCYFSDIDEAIRALVPDVWSTYEKAPLWEVQVRNAINVCHLAKIHNSRRKYKGGEK